MLLLNQEYTVISDVKCKEIDDSRVRGVNIKIMSVKKDLFSGVVYTAIAKYSGMVISLVIAGILARMLTPEDFGIVAIATVIINFFNTFSEMGIGPAIIQNKNLTAKEIASIFTFTVWTGIFISILFFILSWFIGKYYTNPTLIIICRLLSVNLFFATVNIVPNAIVYRNKEFKYIAIRTLGVQFFTGILAVIAVFTGAGIYALVINPILSAVIVFIINYYKYPQAFYLNINMKALKKISGYSFYQLLFNLLNYFGKNLDKLFIGKFMGMTPLGYYEKSYRLMMLPLQNIAYVLSPVMHPVFSEMQGNMQKMLSSYEKIVHLLAYIGFPLSIFLFFTAREITLIIFGHQWMASVPVFRILSLTVGLQILLNTTGSIFQAGNDTRSLFACGVFTAISCISAILIGIFSFGTLEAIAGFMSLAIGLNFLQCYITMYKITFILPMTNFWKQFITPGILSLIIGVVLSVLSLWIDCYSIYISLAVKTLAAFFIFSIYTQLSGEYNIMKKFRKLLPE